MNTTPKNIALVCIAVVLVGLFCWFFYYPSTRFGKQMHNLKIAKEQAAILRAKFSQDHKFSHVAFGEHTGYGGALSVSGNVSNEEDFHYITNVIESQKCPVGIVYMLFSETNAFRWFNKDPEPF